MSPSVEPLAAVHAMDRLNSYARWPGRIVRSAVIYCLKEQAIRALSASDRCAHRRVVWQGVCHHCNGTGWHRAPGARSWGTDAVGERCRTCLRFEAFVGAGFVSLAFVETTVRIQGAPEVVWHSPGDVAIGRELWASLSGPPTSASPWMPRQPGEPLDAHEVARDLACVEEWLWPTWLFVPAELRSYDLRITPGSIEELEPGVVAWRKRHPKPVANAGDDIPF